MEEINNTKTVSVESNESTSSIAFKVEAIRHEIKQAGDDIRLRYPLLRHKNAIAALVLAMSLMGMLLTSWLYVQDVITAWVAIPVIALLTSLMHELEHDLIHWMYFSKKPWAHHLMMALVFLAKPTATCSWLRRDAHLDHHRWSGTEKDIEELTISNGQRWSILRFLMIVDTPISITVNTMQQKTWKDRVSHLRVAGALFPLGIISWGLWYVFLFFHAVNGIFDLIGAEPVFWSAGMLSFMSYLNTIVVILIAPNIFRMFCLHLISSNMHYYGDVQKSNIIQQTQVLNSWWLLPFNLFCFNFGSTHAIHHFVVKEPFWIRQMTARKAHRVMREHGVRFNDFGSFRRANRWGSPLVSESV